MHAMWCRRCRAFSCRIHKGASWGVCQGMRDHPASHVGEHITRRAACHSMQCHKHLLHLTDGCRRPRATCAGPNQAATKGRVAASCT